MTVYPINRRVWFAVYAAAFAVMIYLSMTFGTGWAWGTWAVAFGLFVVLTEPSPRLYEGDPRRNRYDVDCDCPRCVDEDDMRCTCDNPDCDDVTHDVAPEGERNDW